MLFQWLKLIHVLAVAAGVGAMLAQYIVLLAFRRAEDHNYRRMSEKAALTIAQRLQFPALTLALLFGFLLVFVNTEYLRLGHMHAKILLAVLLIGITHMEAANLRRMIMASEQKDEVQVNAFKKRHNIYMSLGLVFTLAIFYLIILKPF